MKKTLLLILLTIAIHTFGQQNNSPLCFTARNDSVTLAFHIKSGMHTIQYSTDSTNWNTYITDTEVTISANQSVYFRAETNQTNAKAFGDDIDIGYGYSYFDFFSSNGGTVEGSGNIMSLYGPDCPNLPLQSYAFAGMFICCSSLTQAPALPATTLASWCYIYMFDGCTSLTQAPALPATTLAGWCYEGMFYHCTSLTQAPALSATTLAYCCYRDMFDGCTSLTQPPVLPATTLADHCYNGMFLNCTSLTQAPALPATTLADWCYYGMFYGCTSLTQAPALPATTLAAGCYAGMFDGCSSLVVNTEAPGEEWMIQAVDTVEDALTDMFYGTGGTMNGTPKVNTTYYVASDTTATAVEVIEITDYKIYSNNGKIFVYGAEGADVRVYDVNGRLIGVVLGTSADQEFVVEVEGIYFVRIDEGVMIKVVVK